MRKIRIEITPVNDDSKLLSLQVARALSGYAALLVEEALGGEVVTDKTKLQFGEVKMKVSVETRDYESQEG